MNNRILAGTEEDMRWRPEGHHAAQMQAEAQTKRMATIPKVIPLEDVGAPIIDDESATEEEFADKLLSYTGAELPLALAVCMFCHSEGIDLEDTSDLDNLVENFNPRHKVSVTQPEVID